MFCKQGDIARIVQSSFGNEGKIVQCLIYVPYKGMDAWITDTVLVPGQPGIFARGILDFWLRPIPKYPDIEEEFKIKKLPVPIKECMPCLLK